MACILCIQGSSKSLSSRRRWDILRMEARAGMRGTGGYAASDNEVWQRWDERGAGIVENARVIHLV